MPDSLFITLEGPEGTGKTTQCKFLAEYLKEKGFDVVLTFEPGGTGLGHEIRNILLNPKYKGITADLTELLLFSAARTQHIDEVILPALESGKVVISDRYTDSTLAYQGYGRGIDLKLIELLNQISTGGLAPDLTILLDLNPEEGLKRIHADGKVEPSRNSAECPKTFNPRDRIESEEPAFHNRVTDGFLEIARTQSRVIVIDASVSISEVKDNIQKIVNSFLQQPLKHNYEGIRNRLSGNGVSEMLADSICPKPL